MYEIEGFIKRFRNDILSVFVIGMASQYTADLRVSNNHAILKQKSGKTLLKLVL